MRALSPSGVTWALCRRKEDGGEEGPAEVVRSRRGSGGAPHSPGDGEQEDPVSKPEGSSAQCGDGLEITNVPPC